MTSRKVNDDRKFVVNSFWNEHILYILIVKVLGGIKIVLLLLINLQLKWWLSGPGLNPACGNDENKYKNKE